MFRILLIMISAASLPLSAQSKRPSLPEGVPVYDAPLVLTLTQDLLPVALGEENALEITAHVDGRLEAVEIIGFQTDDPEPTITLFAPDVPTCATRWTCWPWMARW